MRLDGMTQGMNTVEKPWNPPRCRDWKKEGESTKEISQIGEVFLSQVKKVFQQSESPVSHAANKLNKAELWDDHWIWQGLVTLATVGSVQWCGEKLTGFERMVEKNGTASIENTFEEFSCKGLGWGATEKSGSSWRGVWRQRFVVFCFVFGNEILDSMFLCWWQWCNRMGKKVREQGVTPVIPLNRQEWIRSSTLLEQGQFIHFNRREEGTFGYRSR